MKRIVMFFLRAFSTIGLGRPRDVPLEEFVGTLVSGYRIRDPLNRLTQRELSGFQDFSI